MDNKDDEIGGLTERWIDKTNKQDQSLKYYPYPVMAVGILFIISKTVGCNTSKIWGYLKWFISPARCDYKIQIT